MKLITIMLQGLLFGYLSAEVFSIDSWQYWAAVIANPIFTVIYADLSKQ